MAVLVMDTACETCAVAVGAEDGGGQLQMQASTAIRVPRSHSRRLQPAIQEVLNHAGLEMSDLTAIGVGVGPGSYTGVRIAVSTAKAMAYALRIPLHPISTLAALAAGAVPQTSADSTVALPLLYARRGRAFGALFEKVGQTWTCLKQPAVLPVSDWRGLLADHKANLSVVIHDFVPRYGLAEELDAMASTMTVTLPDVAGNFGHGLLAAFASVAPVTGDGIHAVEPVYLLQTEAESKLAGGGLR